MQKILVLGSSGLVGSRIVELLYSEYELITPSSSEIDLIQKDSFEQYASNHDLREITIINLVAYTNVDGAEKEKDDETGSVYRLNAEVPKEIAHWCKENNSRLIHFSTEYVFDGTKDVPYTEDDSTNPLGWYGKTKLIGDQFIQKSGCDGIILRITMPFRAHLEKKGDLARTLYNRLKNNQPIQAISDGKISPIFIDEIAKVVKVILEKSEVSGVYNIASSDSTTLEGFVRLIAEKAGLDQSLISTISFDDYWKEKVENGASKRPKNSFLDNSKLKNELGIELPTVEKEIEEWLNQIQSNERS